MAATEKKDVKDSKPLNIMEKLSAIQSELKVPKNQYNTHGKYNYRSWEDIEEAVKPMAAKYGLVCMASEELLSVEGNTVVKAIVTLTDVATGDQCESVGHAGIELDAKGMHLPQRFGSASSYAKKYAAGNLFLIDDTRDSDATNTGDEKPQPARKSDAKKEASKVGEKPKATDAQIAAMVKGIQNGDGEKVKKAVTKYSNVDFASLEKMAKLAK